MMKLFIFRYLTQGADDRKSYYRFQIYAEVGLIPIVPLLVERKVSVSGYVLYRITFLQFLSRSDILKEDLRFG